MRNTYKQSWRALGDRLILVMYMYVFFLGFSICLLRGGETECCKKFQNFFYNTVAGYLGHTNM